jgi:hypothetical protein
LFNQAQTALLQYPAGLAGDYTIPDGIKSLGDYAFYGCSKLTSITIPGGVTSIGSDALEDCTSLTSVAIPSSVTSVGGAALAGCSSLTAITVDPANPDYSSLNGVLFDQGQATILQYPAGLAGGYTIPGGVTSIAEAAFALCPSLSSISIPQGVTSIGDYAFYFCSSLPSVTIPSSVTSIGQWAFAECPNLTAAYFQGNAPSGDVTVFSDDPATAQYLPETTGWGALFGGAATALLPSVGTLASGAQTWSGGQGCAWEINDTQGAPGGNPGWDSLDVSGALTVTASSGLPFTISLVTLSGSSAGPAANFAYTLPYSWLIASASGGILEFDPTKFVFSTSQFENFLGGGTFNVGTSSDGTELYLEFNPHAWSPSDMSHSGSDTTYNGADAALLSYTDPYGLASVEVTTMINCTTPNAWAYGPGLPANGQSIGGASGPQLNVPISPLPTGTTNVTILAVKSTGGQYAWVNATATDNGGNEDYFDPELAIVTAGPSVQAQQVYAGLDSAEHYVTIVNGNPGLTSLRLLVNGWTYNLGAVGQGQTVMVNVGASFKPGSTNTIALLGQGPPGATANVLISDQPSGSMLAVTPTIQPPALSIAQQQGNVVVQWLAPADFFTLQGRPGFSPQAAWQDLPLSQQESRGWSSVTLPVNAGPQFFRLRK